MNIPIQPLAYSMVSLHFVYVVFHRRMRDFEIRVSLEELYLDSLRNKPFK